MVIVLGLVTLGLLCAMIFFLIGDHRSQLENDKQRREIISELYEKRSRGEPAERFAGTQVLFNAAAVRGILADQPPLTEPPSLAVALSAGLTLIFLGITVASQSSWLHPPYDVSLSDNGCGGATFSMPKIVTSGSTVHATLSFHTTVAGTIPSANAAPCTNASLTVDATPMPLTTIAQPGSIDWYFAPADGSHIATLRTGGQLLNDVAFLVTFSKQSVPSNATRAVREKVGAVKVDLAGGSTCAIEVWSSKNVPLDEVATIDVLSPACPEAFANSKVYVDGTSDSSVTFLGKVERADENASAERFLVKPPTTTGSIVRKRVDVLVTSSRPGKLVDYNISVIKPFSIDSLNDLGQKILGGFSGLIGLAVSAWALFRRRQ